MEVKIAIQTLIQAHDDLKQKQVLLESIKGIGTATSKSFSVYTRCFTF